MTERPILFSAPMVRAILAGRKTQTRRCLGKQYEYTPGQLECCYDVSNRQLLFDNCPWEVVHSPYGRAGDRLWVRETWGVDGDGNYVYRATDDPGPFTWKSPLFMPKWAARIWLLVEAVRVERVRDITEADARAEGVESVAEYITLWDSLNAKRGFGWDVNPYLWVISFRRVEHG